MKCPRVVRSDPGGVNTFRRDLKLHYRDLHRPGGRVGKVFASRSSDRDRPPFSMVGSHTGDFKLLFKWLPCQMPSFKGTELGLVGPVSVYCDQMKYQVWSAVS